MNGAIELMIGLPMLPAFLSKATALFMLAWVAHLLLAQYNPRWRVLLWRGTLTAIIVLPIAEWTLPALEVALQEPLAESAQPLLAEWVPAQSPLVVVESFQTSAPVPQKLSRTATSGPKESTSLGAWIVDRASAFAAALWAAVTLVLLGATLRAWWRVRALVRQAVPAPTPLVRCAEQVAEAVGVRRRVRLRVLDELGSPFVAGVRRPTIVLPRHSYEIDDLTQLRAVLAHELAHVRTHDPFWMVFARVVSALLWFHPLVWPVRAAHRAACEELCDGVASDYLGSSESYSRVLAREALAMVDAALAPGGVPLLRTANIVHRVRKIRRGIHATPLARGPVVATLIVGAIATVTLGALRVVHAQADPSPATANQPASRFTPIPDDPGSQLTTTVDGIVVDEHGGAIAGVSVLAIQGWNANPPQQTALTDAQGRFTFEDLGSQAYWFFSVDDPRYAMDWVHQRGTKVPRSGDAEPVQIKLYDPRPTAGVVRDERGNPVAGVTVIANIEWLEDQEQPVQRHSTHNLDVTTTDEDGRFRFARLRPGQVSLVLERKGYAQTRLSKLPVGQTDHELTIQDGVTLHGSVIYRDRPAADVQVTAQGIALGRRSIGQWTAVTDENGAFRIDHIPDLTRFAEYGSSLLTAQATNTKGSLKSARYRIYQVEAKRLPEVHIELKREASIDVGKPLAPGLTDPADLASVTFQLDAEPDRDGWRGFPLVTLTGDPTGERRYHDSERFDATGHVEFPAVPPGDYRAYVLSSAGSAFTPTAFSLTGGEERVITFERGPARLSGRIIGAEGRTTRQHVSWFLLNHDFRTPMQGGVTIHEDGRYEVDGLQPGKYRLIYEGENIMRNVFEVEVASGVNTFDLRLPTSRIDGQLIGLKYEKRNEHSLGKIRVNPAGVSGMTGNLVGFLDADDEGRFFIEHLPVGRYIVNMRGPRPNELLQAIVEIDRPDQHVRVKLHQPTKTGQIAGVVRGLDHVEWDTFRQPYISLVAREDHGYEFSVARYTPLAKSDLVTYRFQNLPPGRYGLRMGSSGRREPQIPQVWMPDIEVREGLVNHADIEVPTGRLVRIRFDTHERKPSKRVWALRMPDGVSIPFDHIVGGFADRNSVPAKGFMLPLGSYVIEADFGNGIRVEHPITVSEGEGVQEFVVSMP